MDGIYLIEPFQKDQILLHFNTRANASYVLEWATNLLGDPASPPVWSTLYEAPRLPFPNHYIVVDTRADSRRFYRLRIRF